MKIYLIRHGETPWNTLGRLQGRTDIELNENGIRLAKITGEKLKDVHFDLAIASPLKRAYETARLVLGDRNIPILTDERIEEISFGEWEGLCCRRENYQIPSKDFEQFFTDPFGSFYEDLLHNPDYRNKTILIAAHGCSTRAFLYYIDGRKDDFWRGHVPPNCAVTIIDVKDGKATIEEQDKVYYNPEDVVDFYK